MTARWQPDQLLEYTSFGPSGYTTCQVVAYAPAAEQWQICPACGEQAVPLCPACGEIAVPAAGHARTLRCPRCRGFAEWPSALPPLLDVRTSVGSPLVRVRETQCREYRPPCRYEGVDGGDPAVRVCVTHDPDLGLYGGEECASARPGGRR